MNLLLQTINYYIAGFPSPNPNQFVNQYNNINFLPPMMHQQMKQPNRVSSPLMQQNVMQHRDVPNLEGSDYKGPISQGPTIIQKYVIFILLQKLNTLYNILTFMLFPLNKLLKIKNCGLVGRDLSL